MSSQCYFKKKWEKKFIYYHWKWLLLLLLILNTGNGREIINYLLCTFKINSSSSPVGESEKNDFIMTEFKCNRIENLEINPHTYSQLIFKNI